jgi:hypothetical protein
MNVKILLLKWLDNSSICTWSKKYDANISSHDLEALDLSVLLFYFEKFIVKGSLSPFSLNQQARKKDDQFIVSTIVLGFPKFG